MPDPDVSSQMREDWNARAREDAGYYVAFGRRDSSDAEFFATATEVINRLEWELSRVPLQERGNWRALEIGCGPGRLMRPMSRHFVEIHGVDVSDEMIGLAREKLRDVPNAHVYVTNGSSLAPFADESFDFVYSYAVFQHIPSREVIFEYLREIRRVLRTGGLTVLQFSGLANRLAEVDTWDGVRFTSNELLEFAANQDFQALGLEGAGTQYMWTTWRKQPRGWISTQENRDLAESVRIRRITNANSSEPVAPCRGRFASISIWCENLPREAGLSHLQVTVGSSLGHVCYIGPPDSKGLQQVNVMLPELEATGLLPVELLWLGRRISPAATLRVIPPGPSVPRVRSITDGVNLTSGKRIETRSVKIVLEEIARPHEIEAWIDGHRVSDIEFFCTDPRPQRFEVNFRLPEEIEPGPRNIELRVGRRKLPPIPVEVVPMRDA
ncbi:MAG TPA: class I SAM-dependent methyltransferase [Bryobacteraceae bacterium]|nr:class I SAM-dependent methyltransferase [Bryobacteraceae bacterium]